MRAFCFLWGIIRTPHSVPRLQKNIKYGPNMVKSKYFSSSRDKEITEQMFSVIRLLFTFVLHSACQSHIIDHQLKCLGLDYGLIHFFNRHSIKKQKNKKQTSVNVTQSVEPCEPVRHKEKLFSNSSTHGRNFESTRLGSLHESSRFSDLKSSLCHMKQEAVI